MNSLRKDRIATEIADIVWLRLAVVLLPASEVLSPVRPVLLRLMTQTLATIRCDISEHLSRNDERPSSVKPRRSKQMVTPVESADGEEAYSTLRSDTEMSRG